MSKEITGGGNKMSKQDTHRTEPLDEGVIGPVLDIIKAMPTQQMREEAFDRAFPPAICQTDEWRLIRLYVTNESYRSLFVNFVDALASEEAAKKGGDS